VVKNERGQQKKSTYIGFIDFLGVSLKQFRDEFRNFLAKGSSFCIN